jgi:hypothetical protein
VVVDGKRFKDLRHSNELGTQRDEKSGGGSPVFCSQFTQVGWIEPTMREEVFRLFAPGFGIPGGCGSCRPARCRPVHGNQLQPIRIREVQP